MCVVRGNEVKACPVCGNVASRSCYHLRPHSLEPSVETIWMHKDKATKLRAKYRNDDLKAQVRYLEHKRESLLEDDREYS